MMKLSFLLALSGALALAGNVKAETVLQQMGAAQESEAYAAHRLASAAQLQAQVDAHREARETYQAAYQAAIEQAEREDQMRQAGIQRAKEREARQEAFGRAQYASNQLRYLEFRASINGGRLVDGDPIPQISSAYDDDASIRMYLHDSGYNDVSDVQMANVRDYMHTNHIHHVSELGR